MIKRWLYIVLVLVGFIFPWTVKAVSLEDDLEAIRQTALAYYYKDKYVQYDSYRKDATASPEEASSNHTVYTDCGIFAYQVYKQALDLTIPSGSYELSLYATKNSKSANVIFNMEAFDNGVSLNNKDLLKELDNWVKNKQSFTWQTGDLLVFRRHDGSGHVMIIDASDSKNIKLIESAYTTGGGYYDALKSQDKTEAYSINITSLKSRLQTTIGYQNNQSNSVNQVSVLRFVSEKEKYNLTSSSQSRLKYPTLDITKVAEITNDDATSSIDVIAPGSTITYQITIKNLSNNDYENIKIKETKDAKVSFVTTNDGKVSGNNIEWKINLKSKTHKILTYSVKVPKTANMLGQKIISKGKVDNIATATITHYVENTLKYDQIRKLQDTRASINANLSDMAYISKLYQTALNVDLSYLNNVGLKDILSIKNCASNKICEATFSNKNAQKIAVLNYYGLKIIPSIYQNVHNENIISENLINGMLAWDFYAPDNETRAREIQLGDLQIGDILLTEKNNITESYLVIDQNEIIRSTGQNIIKKTDNQLKTFLQDLIGDNYLLLRPAVKMAHDYPNNNVLSNQKKAEKGLSGGMMENDGIENPECGSFIPYIMLFTLIGGYIFIKFKTKKGRLYRI